jgi:hypothetical protein
MNSHGFLPFSASGKKTELCAIEVKRKLGIAAYGAVDPFEVLSTVPARLVDPALLGANPSVSEALFNTHRDSWSAIGLGKSPASEHELILLNPTHHEHRQRVSLMEEIVHIVLGHTKTTLSLDPSLKSKWSRPYDAAIEDEAYSVGAACILPWPELFQGVSTDRETAQQLATRYHVSVQYVEYRIRRAGLDRVYKARQRLVKVN